MPHAWMKTKKELLELPLYQLSLAQFTWLYPNSVCMEHYRGVKEALEQGLEVYPNYVEEYPSLVHTKLKRKRNAKPGLPASGDQNGYAIGQTLRGIIGHGLRNDVAIYRNSEKPSKEYIW